MNQGPSFLRVAVTGAAGQISYSLLPLLCSGRVFGPNCRLELRLLDIEPCAMVMEGVKMELQDCAYTLVNEIIATVDPKQAFLNADIIIQVGGFPRKQGMLRKDLIAKNVAIFKVQGQAIEKYASRNVKVLVVANPANTNCLVTMEQCPSIPKTNFTCLTRLDHERLCGRVLERLNSQKSNDSNVLTSMDLRNAIIWGNHSSTQYPDCNHAEVYLSNKRKWCSVYDEIQDIEWFEGELIESVQQRGAAVIKARKLSSALSAANAIANHLHDWCFGNLQTHSDGKNAFVSMGIWSEGNSYDIDNNLIYSFPIKCLGNFHYEIVQDLIVSSKSRELMKKTEEELKQESLDAHAILSQDHSNL